MPSLVTIEIPVEEQPSLVQGGDGTSRNTTSATESSPATLAVSTSHRDDNSNDNDMAEVQVLEASSESSVVDTPAPNVKNSTSVSNVQSTTDSTKSTASKKRKQQSIITPHNGENEAPTTSTCNSMDTSNIGSKSSSSHISGVIGGGTAKSKTKAAATAKVVASAKNVAASSNKDAEVSNKKSRKTKTLLSFFKSSTSAAAASNATTGASSSFKTAKTAPSKPAPPTSSSNNSRGGDSLARLESSDTPTLSRSKKGTATIAAQTKSSIPTSSASSSALKGMSAAQRSKLRSIVIGSTIKSSSQSLSASLLTQPTDELSSSSTQVVAAKSDTQTATTTKEQSEMDNAAMAAANTNSTATNAESRPIRRRDLDESTIISNETNPFKKLKQSPDMPLAPSKSPTKEVDTTAAPTAIATTTDDSVTDEARHVVINLLDDEPTIASASKPDVSSVVKPSLGMATPLVTTPGTTTTEPTTASTGSATTSGRADGSTSGDTVALEPPTAPSSELRNVQLFPLPSPPPPPPPVVGTDAATTAVAETTTEQSSTLASECELDAPSVAASTAGSDIVVCNDEGEEGAPKPDKSTPQTARSDTTNESNDGKGRGSNRKRQPMSKSASSASKNTPPAAPVDDAECNALLQKHSALRDTYVPRLQTLWQQGTMGLPEEDFSIPIVASMLTTPPVAAVAESPLQESSGFPAAALGALAALIEGRSDSLEELAVVAVKVLNALAAGDDGGGMHVDVSAVTAQIQLLATRQNYLRKAPAAAALENILVDEHNDSSNGLALWRWEVSAWTHLLPTDAIGKVKRARAARKRWSSQMAALVQLVAALNTADTALCDPAQPKSKRDALLALVGPAEEKVIKLEREAVTHRLAEAARQQKATAAQAQKEHDAQVKQQAKERKKLEAEAAKERKKQEAEAAKERKKMEAEAAKELKKKESESAKAARLAAAQEKEMAEQAELNRQKKALRSFFAKPATSTTNKNRVHSSTTSAKELGAMSGLVVETQPVPAAQVSHRFDSSSFRARIGSHVNDASFSWSLSKPSAKRTSKPRRRGAKKHVSVPVLVTVYPEGYEDNPFSSEQPYTEQQFVSIANKYKFLSFHEDTRPAYYGTWTKQSKSISGRTPLARDTQHLDYDVDSEEEWEADVDNDDCDEIQDEGNRSVDSNGNIDDEDGWLAAEDTEEHDGQGKDGPGLLGNLSQGATTTPRSRFIVPPFHGNPATMASPTSVVHMDGLEGCTLGDAQDFVSTFYGIKLHNHELCLDAFPPSLAEENDPTMSVPPEKTSSMSDETLKEFARFVHNCLLGSKDKVVDEFLQTQKSATACGSRALLYRTLDSIADKRRHPQGGVVWHVKKDVLERLGLECLVSATEQTVEVAKLEALKTIAAFVHGNKTSSKEKLVDDLRSQHESATRSRADALRIVQSIATKIKHPTEGGYYWCVQPDILEQVGLSLLAAHSASRTLTPSKSP